MKSHEAQQTFSFPMLKNSEILSTWEDVPLQGKDLEKPTAISVRAVYEALCEQCIGPCAREDIYNPVEGAMGRIEIPELHEESIQQLTFFKYVSKLLSAAGVNDFSLEDITKPDAKRFRRNLCAIINFQKFRMQCIGDFEDLHSEGQQVMEKCLELDEDIATIEENIQNVQEERQAEQPQIEKIQEECRLLDGDIAKSSGEKDALEYEFKQLKIKNEELKDYMNSLKKQKQEIKDKILLMNENVIRSPERLKGELSSQKSQLESEQETRQKLITAKEELKEKNKSIGKK